MLRYWFECLFSMTLLHGQSQGMGYSQGYGGGGYGQRGNFQGQSQSDHLSFVGDGDGYSQSQGDGQSQGYGGGGHYPQFQGDHGDGMSQAGPAG
jgi:hypothetical protein